MTISTSRITYRRGIPNSQGGFFFAAQANNTIPYPINKYIRGYNFINRNYFNNTNPRNRWPWRV